MFRAYLSELSESIAFELFMVFELFDNPRDS